MRETELTMDGVTGPHGGQPLVTAGAPAMAAEAAVVGLHGRGATAAGFLRICEEFYRHGTTFLLPSASRGRWYPRAFDAPLAANEPDLTSAVDAVRFALDRAQAAGVPPERTLVVGFSQGACVAAEFALRSPRRYGGLGILSGAVPGEAGASRSPEGSLAGTPVLVGCDAADPHVPRERVVGTADLFTALGGDVERRLYDDAGHAVTDDELATLGGWLEGVLSDGEGGSSGQSNSR